MSWTAVLVGWLVGSLPAYLLGHWIGAGQAFRQTAEHPGFADLAGYCICGHTDVLHRGSIGGCYVIGCDCPSFIPPHKESNA